jgi:hypothetical protein
MKLSAPKFHRLRLKVHKQQKINHRQLIINEASWKVFGQIDVSAKPYMDWIWIKIRHTNVKVRYLIYSLNFFKFAYF